MTVRLLNVVGSAPSHWSGLSTDTKPTTGDYGSTFYEEDTGTPYIYGDSGWVMDYRRMALSAANLARVIHAATSKATPVDADELGLWDSVVSGLKKLTWANLKATLKTYFDGLYLPNVLIYQGVIDCSGNPNYPAADAGHVYVVSVAGKIGGGSGPSVEVGDMLLCRVDDTAAGTHAAVGASWDILQTNINGAVVGPTSVVGGELAVFNGATGKLIAASALTGLVKLAAGVPATAVPDTDYLAPGGLLSSASGPVSVLAANNRRTYVATAAVEYDLPTGDLSAYCAAGVAPLEFTFVKTAAGTLTIDPGAGNFIALGGAAKTLTNSVAGETNNNVTLRLISSAASVNTWTITGAFGTWVSTP